MSSLQRSMETFSASVSSVGRWWSFTATSAYERPWWRKERTSQIAPRFRFLRISWATEVVFLMHLPSNITSNKEINYLMVIFATPLPTKVWWSQTATRGSSRGDLPFTRSGTLESARRAWSQASSRRPRISSRLFLLTKARATSRYPNYKQESISTSTFCLVCRKMGQTLYSYIIR